ncbi:hypothetical protein I4U23_027328 [Adineta vaga]|nr:hypothetical protein I4U23_027328 [Adineta vaga]
MTEFREMVSPGFTWTWLIPMKGHASSTGKSMLVQNFLGFPCVFTDSEVATRCPVTYKLHYNAHVQAPRVMKPKGVDREELAKHLGQHMKQIESELQFSHEPYRVEIESDAYPDLEIIDLPGLISGSDNPVERNNIEMTT